MKVLCEVWGRKVSRGSPTTASVTLVQTGDGLPQSVTFAPIALAASGLAMSATDDAIELERRDTTIDHTSLTEFVDEIDTVLTEMPGALAAIPPPSGTSVDRTEAIRLARLSRGTFHPGDLALRGAIDERSFEAGLVFEGTRPVVLRVTVTSLPEGSLHVGPGRDTQALAALPEAAE